LAVEIPWDGTGGADTRGSLTSFGMTGYVFLLRPSPLSGNPTDTGYQRGAAILPRSVMDKVNIAEKFSHITEYWKPYVAAELNGQMVKLDKIKGEFVFHHHDHEDELFLVVKGRFRMEFRDRHVWIEEGEFIVVPRGVEHRPVADEECWFLLFEPASTLNTGNVVNERTVRELERV
jgi:mannose-6-phosphate isomerase-like protein (cupin superfamily)